MLQTVTYTGNKLARVHSKILFSKEGQDHIAIENTHPAIISMEVFEKVQERIESKTKKYTTAKVPLRIFQ
ncbi:recombinase family protein [Alkalihalobacillus alcalophilus]